MDISTMLLDKNRFKMKQIISFYLYDAFDEVHINGYENICVYVHIYVYVSGI